MTASETRGEPVHTLPSDAVPEGGVATFTATDHAGHDVEVFCVRFAGTAYGWVNECPHWLVDLDLGLGEFWDADGAHLVCQNHRALFRPDDGFCTEGPCYGGSLKPVPLDEAAGLIRFYAPSMPASDAM